MLNTEIHDGVGRMTLDRPKVHNAFNDELVSRLASAFDDLGRRPDVRVIVVAGNGRSFCAGADLAWMRRALEFSEDDNLEDARSIAQLFRTIVLCPKPVIARVHGAALGGGAGLVAAADIAIAIEQAVFGFPEVRLGIVPGVISPYVVARIGWGRAREYCLTGEKFSARTAAAIGLIHSVVADEAALDREVEHKIEEFRAAGPHAVAETKWLLAEGVGHTLEHAGDYGARVTARIRAGGEGRAGIQAFLEGATAPWRKPK